MSRGCNSNSDSTSVFFITIKQEIISELQLMCCRMFVYLTNNCYPNTPQCHRTVTHIGSPTQCTTNIIEGTTDSAL